MTVTLSRFRPNTLTAVVVAALLAGTAGAARADLIANGLDTHVDAVAEVMSLNVGGSAGSTTLFVQPTGGDGKSGCNLTGSTTLTLSLASSNVAIATVSPSSVTFTSCGDRKLVTVTPVAAGSASVSAAQTANSTEGSFDLAPATFTVNVAAPAPANTAPVVSITGVVAGTAYAPGSVPVAMCAVTDAEDGPSSFPATLGPVTGLYAADGIGTQEAGCAYTDVGDLVATSSLTYTIADLTAPVIGYTLTPKDPTGDNGWYATSVSLVWSVSDAESPSSVSTTGCVDQSITADQQDMTYSCAASSAGGTAEQVDVTVRRDATAPLVSGTVDTVGTIVGGVTWYKDAATVSWEASDVTSGVAAGFPDPASSVLGEGFGQTATSTADDNAGNRGTGTVAGLNVDASAPTVTAAVLTAPAHQDGVDDWFKDSVSIGVWAADPLLSDGHAGSGLALDPTGTVVRTASGSFSASATDGVGHTTTSDAVAYKVDSAAPQVVLTCPAGDVLLGAAASASWTASDEVSGSGLATPASGSVVLPTGTVGPQVAAAPVALDNVGHASAEVTCAYRVVYDFAGFYRPIDMGGVFNVAKAGSAIPVKFGLDGDQGLGVIAAGYPKVTSVTCPSGATLDAIEETATTTTSGLKYDAVADQYNYAWKTVSTFAGSCKMLTVKLTDGTSQTALFKFTR